MAESYLAQFDRVLAEAEQKQQQDKHKKEGAKVIGEMYSSVAKILKDVTKEYLQEKGIASKADLTPSDAKTILDRTWAESFRRQVDPELVRTLQDKLAAV